MKDNRKIFRPLSMDNYFKRNTPNRFLDGDIDVDYYRKVGDRPEITPRIPILNLQEATQQDAVGIIKVDTNPIGADFYLINQQGSEIPLGATDPSLTVTDIPVGTYNYKIKKQDFQDYNGQITVLENQVCCLDVDLKSTQKSEVCQPVQQQPQAPSGFFISDRDILKMVGLIGLGILVGYLIRSHRD